jgi:hypothetical protein
MSNTANGVVILPTSSEPAAPVRRASSGKLCFGLLLLFIVSLYALPAQMFPALAALHPAQVIAVSALLLLVIEKMTLHQSFVLVWPEGYLLLAFIGAAVLSTFSAFWPLRAYEAAVDLMRILVAYLLIVNTVVSEKRLRLFLFAMIIGALFPAVGTLNGYLRGDLIEGRAHWIGIFGNPNELAYILVMVVPLAVVMASRARNSLRILLWAAIALYVTAIYLTQSRGSLIGLVGVMILLAIRQRGVILKLAMGALLVAGLAFTVTSWTRSDGAGAQNYTVHCDHQSRRGDVCRSPDCRSRYRLRDRGFSALCTRRLQVQGCAGDPQYDHPGAQRDRSARLRSVHSLDCLRPISRETGFALARPAACRPPDGSRT